MQRWRSRLTQYKLRIKHKPGNENIADFLSRCLKHKAYKCSSDLDTEFHINRIVTDSEDFVTESVNQKLPEFISLANLLEETNKDVVLQELKRFIIGEIRFNENLSQFKHVKELL